MPKFTNMFKIWQNMPYICQIYAQAMREICLGHDEDLPKICPRNDKGRLKVYQRNVRDIPNVFL